MPLTVHPSDEFLQSCPVINADHPAVLARARALRQHQSNKEALACATYRFVRDQIRHSGDARSAIMTCSASEVLEARTGWCFAKSHLLAASLRANAIPAALAYQRLAGITPGSFTLHGLNYVWLAEHGWYRCDARGNKPGVTAEFTPPLEQLAWPLTETGETDFPGCYPRPLPQIVKYLQQNCSFEDALNSLPDEVTLP